MSKFKSNMIVAMLLSVVVAFLSPLSTLAATLENPDDSYDMREINYSDEGRNDSKNENKLPDADYAYEVSSLSVEEQNDNIELIKTGESVASGNCGDNLTWSLTKDTLQKNNIEYVNLFLTISGTGAMYDYLSGSSSSGVRAPWYEQYKSFSHINSFCVQMEEGITYIGKNAFYDCGYYLSEISIPSTVRVIGNSSFYHANLERIVFNGDLESIDGSAFNYCSKLKNLEFYFDVKTIGPGAFGNCSSLEKVTFKKSVEEIGYSAFHHCSSLQEVYVNDGLKTIGYEAFRNCSNMTTLTLPEGLNKIGHHAFYECKKMVDFSIPKSVTEIGSNAFSYCESLTEIEIPSGVSRLYGGSDSGFGALYGNGVFGACHSLKKVILPNTLLQLGDCAFWECISLESIIIPENVTVIGSSTFSHCSSLESIILPKKTTYIGDGAFYNCEKIKSIYIPQYVDKIGFNAFVGCKRLHKIEVDKYNLKFDSRNSCNAIIEKETNSLIAGCSLTVIPNDVSSIADFAFADMDNLKTVDIPNSVISIGAGAFYDCKSLYKVSLSNNLETIGQSAFFNCAITKIVIPQKIKNINYGTFGWCSNLEFIFIPASVTDIGGWVIYGNDALGISCNLKDIYFEGNENQWSAITIGDGNDAIRNAQMHYNASPEDVGSINETVFQKGTEISEDDLYDEYSIYLKQKNTINDLSDAVLNDMIDLLATIDDYQVTLTALRYLCEDPVGNPLKWLFFSNKSTEKKENEIADSITTDLILKITDSDDDVIDSMEKASDLGKSMYKSYDKLTKGLREYGKEATTQEVDELAKELARLNADNARITEYRDYLKGRFNNTANKNALKNVNDLFETVGVAFNATDALFFYINSERTDREATELLLKYVEKGSPLYIGLERLHARQTSKVVSVETAASKFIEPFAKKVVKKIGTGAAGKATEWAISIISKKAGMKAASSVAFGTAFAVAQVGYWVFSEALGLFGVKDLDEYEKLYYSYETAGSINCALMDERTQLWNYGKPLENADTEKLKSTDEFLFNARSCAIDQAYDRFCAYFKESELEKLKEDYQKYKDQKADKYETFVNCAVNNAALDLKGKRIKSKSSIKRRSMNSDEICKEVDAQSNGMTATGDDIEVEGLKLNSASSPGGTMPSYVTIPDNLDGVEVIGLGDSLFYSQELCGIYIPDSVLEIGNSTFKDCICLSEVHTSRYLTRIGAKAFSNCTSLSEIDIPVTVSEIADDAFEGIDNLTIIGESGSYAEQYANNHSSISFVCREKKVANIISVTSDQKSIMMSDDIDTSRFTLTVMYDDGTTGTVSDGIYCEFEDKQLGENKVIVCYGNCISEYIITVNPSVCDYTVSYVNHAYEEVAEGISGQATAGQQLTLPAPAVEGYKVDEDTLNVTVGADNNFIVMYTSDYESSLIVAGDVTGDGDVGEDDVVKVARAVEGTLTLTPEEEAVADVTLDGIVAMGDVVKIARYVDGSISDLEMSKESELNQHVMTAASSASEIVPVQGVENAVFSVDEVTAAPGGTVEVPVRVKDNPGFAGVLFEIQYDASNLTLTDLVDGDLLNSGQLNENVNYNFPNQ